MKNAHNKKNNNLKFGEFIRETRLKSAISLREFATQIGISAAYVSKMEIGDYAPPKEENIKKMARILKVSEDQLLSLANKISSDIKDIINTQPCLYAKFLRMAKLKDIESFAKILDSKNGKKNAKG